MPLEYLSLIHLKSDTNLEEQLVWFCSVRNWQKSLLIVPLFNWDCSSLSSILLNHTNWLLTSMGTLMIEFSFCWHIHNTTGCFLEEQETVSGPSMKKYLCCWNVISGNNVSLFFSLFKIKYVVVYFSVLLYNTICLSLSFQQRLYWEIIFYRVLSDWFTVFRW